MTYTLAIPRLTDRQIIDAYAELAAEVKIPDARILLVGVDGALTIDTPINDINSNKQLQKVFEQSSSVLTVLRLNCRGHEILRISRPDATVFDQIAINWQGASQASLNPEQFIHLTGLAKTKLRAIQINAEAPASGIASFDESIKTRFAAISELESLSAQLTFKAQDRLAELDKKYAERVTTLDTENAATKARMEADFASERAKLQERTEALDKREQDIDRSDAKAARRKLREDLQRTLNEHSKRFELSGTTRRLRWPVALLLVTILLGTGGMTYVSFADLGLAISNTNNDWWRIALVSLKQVFFAATFLGFAAYTLRWFEGWSQRHADAEFRFKQLQLDIDRASWVVEVAQEWHKDQGTEVPAELLAQLSRQLFADQSDSSDSSDNVAAAVFGAAARLKLVSPAGELEFDKSGIRRLRKTAEKTTA